ncbi:hypothetical protein KL935_002174 [Ogataea polymorpha]|uniref:Adenosine deaminase domain-containing protein n=1 Tax=Ogataea polymorpha TaxID=460523 RepID=A0A9P8PSJ0_9ASCO|nr:hypothetical protein KL937_001593 [Ogataea polymorpha]KAG7902214.1 hypothetical protein KL935_002174 [Ogataea polymorpha]KAG7911250.1 hypothetical protein KL906_001630 [Ogataea polymorpha]KAG7918204.1 hypothetical protein KL927_001661 [Ogataea polymorpha]KAG7939060.1 hypothetical protein KL904_001589 [Ogataea polymorpha]
MDIKTFVNELPKCELHLHIEGTLTAERRWLCAQANGIVIPGVKSLEELKSQYLTEYLYEEGQDATRYLQEFLEVYYDSMNVLLTEDDFYHLALDYIKVAQSQNIRYLEAFFDPQAHTSRGVSFDTVMSGLLKAQKMAPMYGVQIHWIMCILRDMSAESALETIRQAEPYKDKIIALGLDSDEYNNPPSKFQETFLMARKYEWKITAHCDVGQKNSHDHIEYAVTKLGGKRGNPATHEIDNPEHYLLPQLESGADRIDHGLNAADKPELLELVKKANIGLTLCPMGYQKHLGPQNVFPKVTRLHRYGIPITLNSDDPAYLVYSKTGTILGVAEGCHFTFKDIYEFEKNAIRMAWTPDVEFKESFLLELDRVYSKYCTHN